MVKISACLVVYNEERVIERCLKSLKGTVDEIVLLHDGPCADKTMEIAKRYTTKAYEAPRKGDAALHRHLSVSKATGDWILILDADEYLKEDSKANLRRLAENKEVDKYEFLTETWCDGKLVTKGAFGRYHRGLFYRKSKIAKEKVGVNGTLETTGVTKAAPYWIGHKPERDNYSMTVFNKKSMKYIRMEAAELVKLGKAKRPAIFYLIASPIYFLAHFWSLFKQDIISSGWAGWKISYFASLWYFMRSIEIFRYKIKKN